MLMSGVLEIQNQINLKNTKTEETPFESMKKLERLNKLFLGN